MLVIPGLVFNRDVAQGRCGGLQGAAFVRVVLSPAGRDVAWEAPVAVLAAMIRYTITGSCLPPRE